MLSADQICRINVGKIRFCKTTQAAFLYAAKKHLVGVRKISWVGLKCTAGKCLQVSLEVYSSVMFYKRQKLLSLIRNIRWCDTYTFWNTESTAVTTCWKSVHKHVNFKRGGHLLYYINFEGFWKICYLANKNLYVNSYVKGCFTHFYDLIWPVSKTEWWSNWITLN